MKTIQLNSIGSVLIEDQLCPQYRDGTPDTSAGVYLGDIHIENFEDISNEDKAVLEAAINKVNAQVYALVYAEDFVSPSDEEGHTYPNFYEAFWALRHHEDRNELTIVRAPDAESDFNHVWEGDNFVKYY